MTSDENILEEMLERVTNPKSPEPDNMAIEMFLMVVKSNGNLVTKAHDLIVKKMHSPNVTEANRAIGLLEECMSRAGAEFQNRSSKFLFLNELIALVLDKHDGPPAPDETKQRIMECLMLWSAEHTDKIKIQKAYENLKTQVNFVKAPSTAATSASGSVKTMSSLPRSSILGKDDQLVAKLLKEGGEENYKRANLVIQRNFNQDARRTEFICHLKSEMKKITDTMELLGEMLNSYSSDTPGADSRDIMQELYNTCTKQNEQMARWPDFLGDTEPDFLDDILTTKDQLILTLQTYRELFETDILPKITENKALNASIPSTLSSPKIAKTTTKNNTDLLSDLLVGDINTNASGIDGNKTEVLNNKDLDLTTASAIDELFGSIELTKTESSNYPSDLFNNMDLLEPTSVFDAEKKNITILKEEVNLAATNGNHEEITKPPGFKELREIDKISEEIFKQTLQTQPRQATFKKDTEKITLNDLAKDKIQASLKSKNSDLKKVIVDEQHASSNDIDEISKDNLKESQLNTKDEQVNNDNLKTLQTTEEKIKCEEPKDNDALKSKELLPYKPLAEINIDLDDVTPLPEGSRLIFDDDDIQVTLNFTADRPSNHVSVIVMSVANKSKLPVREFQFEASVKKPCKVRLLPPTDTEMAPTKPFRPAASINQVVLLLNATQKPVDLTCVVGYKLGDDPDPIKEPIVAKDIPYV